MNKMNFFEALAIASEKRQVRYKGGSWSYYVQKLNKAVLLDQKSHAWWPTIEEQQENNWEVEPEELVVWCVCDQDGSSFIFTGKPYKSGNGWICHDDEEQMLELNSKNLFPKVKPQKYKVTPISD